MAKQIVGLSMLDTQPMEGSILSQNIKVSDFEEATWGWLLNMREYSTCNIESLEGERITVGREGDIVIAEEPFLECRDENRKLLKISRIHFEIQLVHGRAVLVDKSTNGTFVNQLKMKRKKPYRLNHGNVISLLISDFSFYYLILRDHVRVHYPELFIGGYLVGRRLGQGASAVVREALMLHGAGYCRRT